MKQPPVPEFSMEMLFEQRWQEIRQYRNNVLKEVDIKINKLEDNGEDASAWRTYRKALRDLPSTTDNPTKVVWPTRPE